MRSSPHDHPLSRIGRLALGAGLAAIAWTGQASAVTCFIIFDRNDIVVYRDSNPPVDLSDTGSRERQALRARGMHLLMAEFDQCYSSGYLSAATGGATAASVDEIVLKLRPAIDPAVGQPGRQPASGTSGASNYVAPAAKAPASIKR